MTTKVTLSLGGILCTLSELHIVGVVFGVDYIYVFLLIFVVPFSIQQNKDGDNPSNFIGVSYICFIIHNFL